MKKWEKVNGVWWYGLWWIERSDGEYHCFTPSDFYGRWTYRTLRGAKRKIEREDLRAAEAFQIDFDRICENCHHYWHANWRDGHECCYCGKSSKWDNKGKWTLATQLDEITKLQKGKI